MTYFSVVKWKRERTLLRRILRAEALLEQRGLKLEQGPDEEAVQLHLLLRAVGMENLLGQ